jgi:hypothetical protein
MHALQNRAFFRVDVPRPWLQVAVMLITGTEPTEPAPFATAQV